MLPPINVPATAGAASSIELTTPIILPGGPNVGVLSIAQNKITVTVAGAGAILSLQTR
jgi:hypothetical protein